MAFYVVISGEIEAGRLYIVAGVQSVTYNTVTYTAGQYFRGVQGVNTFTYSGTGTQIVNEVTELKGAAMCLIENGTDYPTFSDVTLLSGFALEYELTNAEKVVNETTKILGFALELIDYPFYSFEITETRL